MWYVVESLALSLKYCNTWKLSSSFSSRSNEDELAMLAMYLVMSQVLAIGAKCNSKITKWSWELCVLTTVRPLVKVCKCFKGHAK